MLRRIGSVSLPSHAAGGYDHADVHLKSGKVYIAHTADGSVEVVDGPAMKRLTTISDCAEASGVLCAQEGNGLVFAAARGAGKILVLDPSNDQKIKEIRAGFKPNGLAWDSRRRHLMVADVQDNQARLFDVETGRALGEVSLKGRPRWATYHPKLDRFLVNVREPPGLAFLSPDTLAEEAFVPVAAVGPHGLEIDIEVGRGFVACDGQTLVAMDLAGRVEVGRMSLSGPPDVIWFNRKNGHLYCAVGTPGCIDIIDTESLSLVEKVDTEEGAHTLTFDQSRQLLYALLPKTQSIVVYADV